MEEHVVELLDAPATQTADYILTLCVVAPISAAVVTIVFLFLMFGSSHPGTKSNFQIWTENITKRKENELKDQFGPYKE